MMRKKCLGKERKATAPPKDTVGRRHSGHPGRGMMKSRGEECREGWRGGGSRQLSRRKELSVYVRVFLREKLPNCPSIFIYLLFTPILPLHALKAHVEAIHAL